MLSRSLQITSPARAIPRFLSVVLLSYAAVNFAATPKFLLTPTSRTKATLPTNQTATITYKVTNQTAITRTLTIKPISGATQITTGSGACANPFTLSPGSSCDLVLRFVGSPSAATIAGGPVVCKTKSSTNTDPDPFLCSQPATADKLLITRIEAKSQLSISPSSLILTADSPYTPGTITVTNNSTRTIDNVAASLSGTVLSGYVTQDSSACTTLTSGASCQLIFTPSSTAVSATSFPIKGDASTAVGAKITINNPAAPSLSVTNSPLTVTEGSIGTLIVRNTSSSVSAYNVTAYPLPTALSSAGVTTPAIACLGPIAPGHTCSISIDATASSTAVTSRSVVVQAATNSNSTASAVTGASVAINGTVRLSLSPSSRVIYPNTSSTASMTITNNGTLTVNDVSANFENTALYGHVTATSCPSISPGGTCVMTFTANTATVSATSFPISSSSPVGETVYGTIELIAQYIYFSNNSTSSPEVSVCEVNSTTGAVSLCHDVLNDSSLINGPWGMALNSSATSLYIANVNSISGDFGVTQCTIDADSGRFISCSLLTDNTFSNPTGVYINTAGTYAYVVNYGSASVSICQINSSGSFYNCTANYPTLSTGGFTYPVDITLNPSQTSAYITYGYIYNGYLAKCSVSGSGSTLSSCQGILISSQKYGWTQGVTINRAGTYVYPAIANVTTPFAQCTSDLSSCSSSYTNAYLDATGIAMNAAGNYLYINNSYYYSGYSYQCPVTDDTITTCNTLPSALTYQYGIALLNN